jgi:hypothetical protein
MSSKLAKLIVVAVAIAALLRVQLTRRRVAEQSGGPPAMTQRVRSCMRKLDAAVSEAARR